LRRRRRAVRVFSRRHRRAVFLSADDVHHHHHARGRRSRQPQRRRGGGHRHHCLWRGFAQPRARPRPRAVPVWRPPRPAGAWPRRADPDHPDLPAARADGWARNCVAAAFVVESRPQGGRSFGESPMKLIGVDVVGPLHDVVLFESKTNATAVHKVPTTSDDPSRGVMQGVLELCRSVAIDPGAITHLYHGTTIATNAVLEYKGARTGMITTKGYRDIIHIGRHQRPMHYSIMQEIPWQHHPLVRRAFRKVAAERLGPATRVLGRPRGEDGGPSAARDLARAGVEAVAVCFLFSYLNPAHEERAKKIVLEEFPQAFV